MIVVDSSAVIDVLRGQDSFAARKLRELEEAGGQLAFPAVVCQEVLQGAADDSDWQLLVTYLSTQDILAPEDPWATHLSAARIFYDCRREGLTIRSASDCLIAQLALEADAPLLHRDADFDHIAQVRPLRIGSPAATG